MVVAKLVSTSAWTPHDIRVTLVLVAVNLFLAALYLFTGSEPGARRN